MFSGDRGKMLVMISDFEEWLAKEIVDCGFKVHKQLGPGLLEKIYETCLCYELSKKNISYQRQVYLPVKYDNLIFDEGLQLDILVENKIICELKAVDAINPIWQAQISSHLKLTGLQLGFLINFNVTTFKEGIKRYII